jgi:hypothetical protein
MVYLLAQPLIVTEGLDAATLLALAAAPREQGRQDQRTYAHIPASAEGQPEVNR